MPLGGGAAAAESGFDDFLGQMERDAYARGIRPATIAIAFRYIQYLPQVIELDHRQPEHKITFAEYFAKVVTAKRLDEARRHLVDNWALLDQVRRIYDVQPRFIVALWGVESDFGQIMGNYPVPAALATLAYDGRRGALFRAELMSALKILDDGDVGPAGMLGSWAGAMGQCQFMPSTFLRYAVDFDREGRRNIWTDRADALASIANYLSHLGWRGNEDWGRPVTVPSNLDPRYANLGYRLTSAQWARLGLRPAAGVFTRRDPSSSLVLPDGVGGAGFLVYDNFRAIKRWNDSTYFAAAVGTIADSIARS
ncbi:MAG TPA: lytic murein transglycosylase [Stellaceae bacterium]|nr:lytic murein transglycosylase [Stellaceae bacterium]